MLRKLSVLLVSCLLISGCIIKGTIEDEGGKGIDDVEVILHGDNGDLTTYTDVDGNYVFNNLLPGKYTVTPILDPYTFTPKTVQIFNERTIVNFVGIGRFTDMGDGTVRDNLSGLIWLKNANTFPLDYWEGAVETAATLDAGDFEWLTDGSSEGAWRLPTKGEWEAFVDTTYIGPALSNAAGDGQWSEGDVFKGVQSSAYWSCTIWVYKAMWAMDLEDGESGGRMIASFAGVWPVRSDK